MTGDTRFIRWGAAEVVVALLGVAAAAVALLGLTGPAAAGTVHATAGGTWGKAKPVPGIATLSRGGGGSANAVSCFSPGNCGADGSYGGTGTSQQAFVLSEVNGTWGAAQGVAQWLNTGGLAEADSVSCAPAGNCSASGSYTVAKSGTQRNLFEVFVVGETNGVWGTAEELPGTAALNTAGFAQLPSLSCTSAGHCSAVGEYEHGRIFGAVADSES